MNATCSNCKAPSVIAAKGLCGTCYQRQRRRAMGMKPKRTPLKGIARKLVSCALPLSTYNRVSHAASLRGLTVSEVIREALIKRFGG